MKSVDLRSRKRDRMTTLARQVAMYMIRQETDLTLNATGQVLGGQTPATVTYGYQVIAKALEDKTDIGEVAQDCISIYHKGR